MIVSTSAEPLFSEPVTDSEVELYSGAPIRGHVPVLSKITYSCNGQGPPPVRLKLDIDSLNWNNWHMTLENTLGSAMDGLSLMSPMDQWKFIEQTINSVSKENGKFKKSCIHSKPYWTDELSVASNALRDAKKSYGKRNTLSNKEALDKAKDTFDQLRKSECQKFILDKTKSLNESQCRQFWKDFNRLFKKKGTGNSIEPIKTDDGKILTDNNEIEEVLFDSFFDGKHLREKGVDFDDEFYQQVNEIHDNILDNDASVSSSNPASEKLNGKILMEELEFCIKSYKTEGKGCDNSDFHPLMLKHLGVNAKNVC